MNRGCSVHVRQRVSENDLRAGQSNNESNNKSNNNKKYNNNKSIIKILTSIRIIEGIDIIIRSKV